MYINYYLRWQYAKQTRTLLVILFVCDARASSPDRDRDRERECRSSFVPIDSCWTIALKRDDKIFEPRAVLRTHIAALYLFMVASDCSSFCSRKVKYCGCQNGHLRILFAYSCAFLGWSLFFCFFFFFSFVSLFRFLFALRWLTCRFHHTNCLHSSFWFLLFSISLSNECGCVTVSNWSLTR